MMYEINHGVMMIAHLYHKIANGVVGVIGKINWEELAKRRNPTGLHYRLTEDDHKDLS